MAGRGHWGGGDKRVRDHEKEGRLYNSESKSHLRPEGLGSNMSPCHFLAV